MAKGIIAVDLDGTLAHHESSWGVSKIGDPIPSMLANVKQWISEGRTVVIFTARAVDKRNIPMIKVWLEQHGIGGLTITNIKTPHITMLYDDRAVQVEKNTGKILGRPNIIKEHVKENNDMESTSKKFLEELNKDVGEPADTPSTGPEDLGNEPESGEVNDDYEAGTAGTENDDSILEGEEVVTEGEEVITEDPSTGPVGLTDMPEEGEDKDKAEAGSKGMPSQADAMPVANKGSRDSNNADTESDGDLSQAAGQELHPVGSMVEKGVKNNFDGEAVTNQSDEAMKQGGECKPTEIAKKAVTGLFK